MTTPSPVASPAGAPVGSVVVSGGPHLWQIAVQKFHQFASTFSTILHTVEVKEPAIAAKIIEYTAAVGLFVPQANEALTYERLAQSLVGLLFHTLDAADGAASADFLDIRADRAAIEAALSLQPAVLAQFKAIGGTPRK